jgi:SAM-dependent methyltransferase
MSITHTIQRQFGRPEGLLGRLAGRIMATRGSNIERSLRTVDLLDVQPEHRVLEVGHGPGIALAALADKVHDGSIVGLDHSELMHRQAARRNRQTLEDGRLALIVGEIEDLDPAVPFDRIMLVNVAMFWEDPTESFRSLSDLLAPGGVMAVTHQPRDTGASAADTDRATESLARQLEGADLSLIATDRLEVGGVPAVCLRATRGDAGGPGRVPQSVARSQVECG